MANENKFKKVSDSNNTMVLSLNRFIYSLVKTLSQRITKHKR